jgi:hypothetical protein
MFRCSHTIIRERITCLSKVTVVKTANLNTSVCGDVAAYISGTLLVCVGCTVWN